MKLFLIFLCSCFVCQLTYSQGSVNNEVKLKELAVPSAPSFKLLDVSPTQIESPTNPKQFALGIAKAFSDSLGWPQNYSMQFAPYWWLKSSNRSVYDFLGLKTTMDAAGARKVAGQDLFAGLKFASLSLAFVNQDLVPDTIKKAQKVFSVGLHTNIIRIRSKSYAALLEKYLQKWHDAAQKELDVALANQPADSPNVVYEAYWQRFTDFKPVTTNEIYEDLSDLIKQKPLFSLDVSAAYSTYGISDSSWKSGRTGLWTTASIYLPFDLGDGPIHKNFFGINGYMRVLQDNYAPGKNNFVVKSGSLDVGGKFEMQFDKFTIAYEIIHRNYFNGDARSSKNRSVGLVNYQLNDNLYINGAFGKDFGITNKLISSLGINWGFGTEKTKLE